MNITIKNYKKLFESLLFLNLWWPEWPWEQIDKSQESLDLAVKDWETLGNMPEKLEGTISNQATTLANKWLSTLPVDNNSETTINDNPEINNDKYKDEVVNDLNNSQEYKDLITKDSENIQNLLEDATEKKWDKLSSEQVTSIIKTYMDNNTSEDFKSTWIKNDRVTKVLATLYLNNWKITVEDVMDSTPEIVDAIYKNKEIKDITKSLYEVNQAMEKAKEEAKNNLENSVNDISNKLINRFDKIVNSDDFQSKYEKMMTDVSRYADILNVDYDTQFDEMLKDYKENKSSWDEKLDKQNIDMIISLKDKSREINNSIKELGNWDFIKDIMDDFIKDWVLSETDKSDIKSRIKEKMTEISTKLDFLV